MRTLICYFLLCVTAFAIDYPVTVEKVHDADTFVCTIHLGFDVDLTHQTVRIRDFDAYEIDRTRRTVGVITDEEIANGKKAKAILEQLFAGSKKIYVTPAKDYRGAYSRLQLRVSITDDWTEDQDVAALLTAMGYSRDVKGKLWTLEEFRAAVDKAEE